MPLWNTSEIWASYPSTSKILSMSVQLWRIKVIKDSWSVCSESLLKIKELDFKYNSCKPFRMKHFKIWFNLLWPDTTLGRSAPMCLRCPKPSAPWGLGGGAGCWVSHSCANNQSPAMASGLRPTICVHVLLGLRGNTFPRRTEMD